MKARPGFDPASLIAGLLVIAFGLLLLLDQAEVLVLHAEYAAPATLAVIGGILLACGLAGPPQR